MMGHLKDFRQEAFHKSADGSYQELSGERDVWSRSKKKARRQMGIKEKKILKVICMEESTNWKLEGRERERRIKVDIPV